MSERTKLQLAARALYDALSEATHYTDRLERTPGGEAVARKVRIEIERCFDWLLDTTIMHPEDGQED